MPRPTQPKPDLALCSGASGSGSVTGANLDWSQYDCTHESPKDLRDILRLSRLWASHNWLIAALLPLRAAFINSELKIKTDKAPNEFADQMAADVAAIITEALTVNNVIAAWSPAAPGPRLLRPELAEYSDEAGIELLRYQHGVSSKVRDMLPPALRQRYQNPWITYGDAAWERFNAGNPAAAQYFKVWKTSARGHGLAVPRMRAFFRSLGQNDSMEVGESEYAFAGRLVLREHTIGHEIKNGPNAGSKKNFYTQARADGIKRELGNAVGYREVRKNFDHTISVNWIDPKKYDPAKWETIRTRLMWWAGSLGSILANRGANPDLLNALETETLSFREAIRPFITQVLSEAYNTKVRVVWGLKCFSSARLFAEQLKFLVQQGPGSLTTATERILGDDSSGTERENKKMETENFKEFVPLFDASHGGSPTLSAPGGRPKKGT